MRGVIFRGLPPRKQWEGGGEAGGRRPGPGWRCWRPGSSAPGRGVSPGHWAHCRGVPARESRGRCWQRPGRRRGRGPSPPAGTERATRPGVGVSTSSPRCWPRPLSTAVAQVGAGRGAHVGKQTAGHQRQPGSWGSAPSPPLLPSSPPRDGTAPPEARLRRLRRSPGCSPLATHHRSSLARPPVAAWAAGIAASSGGRAGRGGADGGDRV